MRRRTALFLGLVVLVFGLTAGSQRIGDERALPFHILEQDITDGSIDLPSLIEAGRFLFCARFTVLDGAGRPGSTGSGLPTRRPLDNAKQFLRTSGPDSNSCAGCHNQPEIGGAGDFVTGVFVGAQEREPVLLSISPEFSAERGTTSMHGSGLIELLAREMTRDLLRIRSRSIEQARTTNREIRSELITKNVSFGYIRAFPDGTVSTSEVEGVDKDLIIRPWSQKGVVTSLRTFTVTALNHHHGMQAVERFGLRRTGSSDFDRDGVTDEITEGDVTALALFQATLPVPTVVLPNKPNLIGAVEKGRRAFEEIGCGSCHRPALPLESTLYSEPGPFNLEGTLRASEVSRPFAVDLASLPWGARLKRDEQGRVLVECFCDLKRHRIADGQEPYFANEVVSQGFAPTDEFITKRLWDAGNTAPYGHRGDLTTLREAIMHHGGQAQAARLRYAALPQEQQASMIEFMRTLQIVPDKAAPEPAPNRLSSSLEALVVRWESQSSAIEQLVSRAEAAAERAERTRDQVRSLALRIDHERAKIASSTDTKQRAESLPGKPVLIAREIAKSTAVRGDSVLRILNAIERSEDALNVTYDLSERALQQAAMTQTGEPLMSLGHLDSRAVLQRFSLERQPNVPSLELMVSWCEDVTFRVEQLGQRVAMAEMRIEARANQAR